MTAWSRWLPLLAVVVAVSSAGAVLVGILPPSTAVKLFLIIEIPLWVCSAAAVAWEVRSRMRSGSAAGFAMTAIARQSPAWSAVRYELRLYRALLHWVRRRCDIPVGATAVRASSGSVAVPVAFIVATVIEVAVLHLLIPWAWLQVTVLVLSVWSLIAVLGLLAVDQTRPHYLTDEELVIRYRGRTVARVARTNIAAVTCRRRFLETTPTIRGEVLALPSPDGTTIDIATVEPVQARLRSGVRTIVVSQSGITRVHLDVGNPEYLLGLRSPTTW